MRQTRFQIRSESKFAIFSTVRKDGSDEVATPLKRDIPPIIIWMYIHDALHLPISKIQGRYILAKVHGLTDADQIDARKHFQNDWRRGKNRISETASLRCQERSQAVTREEECSRCASEESHGLQLRVHWIADDTPHYIHSHIGLPRCIYIQLTKQLHPPTLFSLQERPLRLLPAYWRGCLWAPL